MTRKTLKAPRIHREFTIGKYCLWLDRVPVVHGMATLATLWRKRSDGAWERLEGGILRRAMIRFIQEELRDA